jgi:hypothetical protein
MTLRNEQEVSVVCFRENALAPRAFAPTQGKDRRYAPAHRGSMLEGKITHVLP